MPLDNATQPDVRLLLDPEGVIREFEVYNDIAGEPVTQWLGRSWSETVSAEEAGLVSMLVQGATERGASPFLRLDQHFPSGLRVPVEYTTVWLGEGRGFLAIGRDMRTVAQLQTRLAAAQRSLERDYWKLRQLETRYRVVFQSASDAVLMVGGADLRVTDINRAALAAFGLESGDATRLVGRELSELVGPAEGPAVRAALRQAREHGQAPALLVHPRGGAQSWRLRAHQVAPDEGQLLLVQLLPGADDGLPAPGTRQGLTPLPTEALLEHSPDAWVVLDTGGGILYANPTFLELCQVGALGAILGVRLERWLGAPGAGAGALLRSAREHGVVRLFRTVIRGDLGTETRVEISGAALEDGVVGLCLRDVSRRLDESPPDMRLHRALGSMREQLGETPLKELVGSTVELVERHYIEAALELCEGNRTAAARLLGLSRQSLYVKLARYGIADETISEQDRPS